MGRRYDGVRAFPDERLGRSESETPTATSNEKDPVP